MRYMHEYLYGSLYLSVDGLFPFPHPVLDLVLRSIHRLHITLHPVDRLKISYLFVPRSLLSFAPQLLHLFPAIDPV
jgi:hypothetical protein